MGNSTRKMPCFGVPSQAVLHLLVPLHFRRRRRRLRRLRGRQRGAAAPFAASLRGAAAAEAAGAVAQIGEGAHGARPGVAPLRDDGREIAMDMMVFHMSSMVTMNHELNREYLRCNVR